MQRSDDIHQLPGKLPIPQDDGACAHLPGKRVPSLALAATSGASVDLAALGGRTVVYCYPRTGRPDQASPTGWDDIPGARGCTPQSCGFRDHYDELLQLGIGAVFGLSSQDSAYQREAVERLKLPFALLSDEKLEFARALGLPTFEVDGMTLVKRVTLVVHDGAIEHVFYPVFPPDASAPDVVHWIVERKTAAQL